MCIREETVASPSLARSPAMHEGFHLRDWKVMTIMKILRLFYYDYDDDNDGDDNDDYDDYDDGGNDDNFPG